MTVGISGSRHFWKVSTGYRYCGSDFASRPNAEPALDPFLPITGGSGLTWFSNLDPDCKSVSASLFESGSEADPEACFLQKLSSDSWFS
jgi:hypothetical protein